jgi:hypothetical protein
MDTITKAVHPNVQKAISPVYLIERPAIAPDMLEQCTEQMSDTARQVLQHEQARIKIPLHTTAHFTALPDHIATDAIVQHHHAYLTTRQLGFVQTEVKIDSGVLLPNTRILTPPYDADWAQGAGSPLSRLDGSMVTMGIEGFSASGFGFNLSSPQQMVATIEPVGEYDYSWSGFGDYPSLYSSGGIGITVYHTPDPAPVLNRRATLYEVQGPRQFKGDVGRGSLSDINAGINEPGFFRFPLTPFDLVLEAQQNYLVWIWTWQIQSGSQDAAFLSFVGCKVPMIFVSTNAVTYPVLH